MGRQEGAEGKEDSDETEDEANLLQEKIIVMETFDNSLVEGQPEGESVVQRAVECQVGMTEEEDIEIEEGEVVIQDGEDAGEVSGEEHNVLKADPKLWQQRNTPQELAGENRQRIPVDTSTFSTMKGCSTGSGSQKTLMLRIYKAVSNWCPRSVIPLCCTLPMTFQWLGTSR